MKDSKRQTLVELERLGERIEAEAALAGQSLLAPDPAADLVKSVRKFRRALDQLDPD